MKPRIQIVDEKDHLIGHKYRNEIDYDKDIYRVSTLWLENSQGEVLIAQRKLTKDKDPGKWGPAAAGTLDEGETYDSNIYKEAEEEIGLTGVKFQFKAKLKRNAPHKYFIHVYFAKIDKDINDFKLQEEEVEQITWISKRELITDFKANPGKYVPAMVKYVDIFIDNNT